MNEKERQIQEDETPTMKKLRALVYQVGTATIAYETVIPQVILTLLFGGITVYLAATGQNVPEWLLLIDGTIIGFYFGSDFEFRRLTGKVKKNG